MFLSPSLGTRKAKTKYRAPFRLIKIPSSSFFFPNVLLIFSTRFKVKFSSNDPLEINKEESKATMIIIIIVIREVITKGERERGAVCFFNSGDGGSGRMCPAAAAGVVL